MYTYSTYFYLTLLFVWEARVHIVQGLMQVEVRAQLSGVSFSLPVCRFQATRLDSKHLYPLGNLASLSLSCGNQLKSFLQ